MMFWELKLQNKQDEIAKNKRIIFECGLFSPHSHMMIQRMLDGNKIKVKETIKGKSLLLASEHRDLRIGLTHLNVDYCREPREWEMGRVTAILGRERERGKYIYASVSSPRRRCLP